MKLLSAHLLIKKELLKYIYMKTGTKDGVCGRYKSYMMATIHFLC